MSFGRPRVVAMVLAHARAKLLPLIAHQLQTVWGKHAHVDILLDNPTEEVRWVTDTMKLLRNVRVKPAPFSPLGAGGEKWMELRNYQLDWARELKPEYAAMWDDDHVLSDPIGSCCSLLTGVPMTRIMKTFFWGDLDHVNAAVPPHDAVFWFRVEENDAFPTDRVIHAPAKIYDTQRWVRERGELLDIGYLEEADRLRVFNAYKRAGKIDASVTPLVQPAHLVPYSGNQGLWYRKLKEVMCGSQ